MPYRSISRSSKIIAFIMFLFIFISISLFFTNSSNHQQYFKVPAQNIPIRKDDEPVFESSLIPQPNYLLAAHSASFAVLPDDSLIAVWFAGSHEGKPDVETFQSYFKDGQWTLAKAIVSREELSRDTHLFVKKLGNPVIYRALDNALHLFVVSVSVGGWSGSSINHLTSIDGGKTWRNAKKLILSPVFNISSLVRINPITLTSGGFYLPIYHEAIRTYPELLYFNSKGDFISQRRFNNGNHLVQPAIAVLSSTEAYVYFRNHSNKLSDVLMMQQTKDGGMTWSKIIPTNLSNPDASIAVINLDDGRILMVRNVDDRRKLVLSITHDGVKWKNIAFLEKTNSDKSDMEFSYPNIQMHDGMIDILYTWKRKDIKHVRFNLPWVNQQESKN